MTKKRKRSVTRRFTDPDDPDDGLAPGTRDGRRRAHTEWEACAKANGFDPYRESGPTKQEIVQYLLSVVDTAKGRLADDGRVSANLLEDRIHKLGPVIRRACPNADLFRHTKAKKAELAHLTECAIEELGLESGRREKVALGLDEALRLIRKMIADGSRPGACLEQALQQTCLLAILTATGRRCGSIAVSRGYPLDHCLTLNDIEINLATAGQTLADAEPTLTVKLTIRHAKAKIARKSRAEPDVVVLHAAEDPAFFDACPVLRLLALLFYRGALRDFETPADLFASRRLKVHIDPARTGEPLMLAAKKRGGGRSLVIQRPEPGDETEAAATADGCASYFKRFKLSCGYPKYGFSLHSTRHAFVRRLSRRHDLEAVRRAGAFTLALSLVPSSDADLDELPVGHAPNSGVTRQYDDHSTIDLTAELFKSPTSTVPSPPRPDLSAYGEAHRNQGPVVGRLDANQRQGLTRSQRIKALSNTREAERLQNVDAREVPAIGAGRRDEEATGRPRTRLEWLERALRPPSSPELYACELCDERTRMSQYERPTSTHWTWPDLVKHTRKAHRLLLPSSTTFEGPDGHYGMLDVTPSPSPPPIDSADDGDAMSTDGSVTVNGDVPDLANPMDDLYDDDRSDASSEDDYPITPPTVRTREASPSLDAPADVDLRPTKRARISPSPSPCSKQATNWLTNWLPTTLRFF